MNAAQLQEIGANGAETPPEGQTSELPPESQGDELPPAEPPKKRRGRPPKDRTLNAETPGAAPSSGSATPKKRGAKPTAEKIGLMAKQIQGIHVIAAMASGIPELQLSEHEAGMLADAIVNVSVEYGLAVDGKTGAAIQLIGTAGMIYFPRYMSFKSRVAKSGVSDATIVGEAGRATPAH